MAMTKIEAAKLTNDVLLRGVIETILSESSILQLLPFEDVNGTAITYNRENAAPTVTGTPSATPGLRARRPSARKPPS